MIITEANIIKTYNEKQQRQVERYNKFSKLKSKCTLTEIARKTKTPISTIDGWRHGKIPYPLKIVLNLKQRKLLPLKIKQTRRFMVLLDCLAFIFGDGSIPKAANYCYFYGYHEDLKSLENLIKKYFHIKTKLTDRTKNNSWLVVSDTAFARLLVSLGAPTGDKAIRNFKFPHWIKSASKEIKKEFVEVLLGNELTTPSRVRQASFDHVRFSMKKSIDKVLNLIKFLEEFRQLLEEFKIKTKSAKVNWNDQDKRKDGIITVECELEVDNNRVNILKLWKTFQLKYATNKQNKFDKEIAEILPYLKDQLQDCNLYRKAKELHFKGLGARRISKKLNAPHKLGRISNWLSDRCKPKMLSFEQELKEIF